MFRVRLVFLLGLGTSLFAVAQGFDCLDLPLPPASQATHAQNPSEDFSYRDQLPQTEIDTSQWKSCCGAWGPCPVTFPAVAIPQGEKNPTEWARIRVIEAAKRLMGLPYGHFHIPAMGGLDCSNFSAWVYNYAFGIRISSEIRRQAAQAGRILLAPEILEPGDLVFLWNREQTQISHVALYVNKNTVIDSSIGGVALRPFAGRYKSRFAWARRLIE